MTMQTDYAWNAYLQTCKAHSIPQLERDVWETDLANKAAEAAAQDAAQADAWKPHQKRGHEHAHTPFRDQGDGPDMAQADKVGEGTDRAHVDVDPHDSTFATKAELKAQARARKFGR